MKTEGSSSGNTEIKRWRQQNTSLSLRLLIRLQEETDIKVRGSQLDRHSMEHLLEPITGLS